MSQPDKNDTIRLWECDECGWSTDSPEDQAHSTPRCLGAGRWREFVAVDALLSNEALEAAGSQFSVGTETDFTAATRAGWARHVVQAAVDAVTGNEEPTHG